MCSKNKNNYIVPKKDKGSTLPRQAWRNLVLYYLIPRYYNIYVI